MEPQAPTGPTALGAPEIEALHRAARIYLDIAYPDGHLPPVVQRRLEWSPGADPNVLLNGPPFERAGKHKTTGSAIYALRLGNARYPHMKLQVQPWPNGAGFMLSVNTHDQVLALDPESEDMPAFREIQAENQRLKEGIEQAWDQAGLPTFLRYLREYLEQRVGQVPPEAGSEPPQGW